MVFQISSIVQPLVVPFLYWTLSSLGTIFSAWTNADRIQDEKDFINPFQSKPYDFIIVGAGSAGCLLANRLSRTYSVLLIEAGGEPNPLQFIPGFALFFPNFPEIDWMHRSVPQRFGTLMSVNGQSSWSTGLGLGGTGNLNYMIHLRGHRKDFDNWANITGDPSWSWEGVLPYFRSYEDYEIPGDNVNHGYGGDLRIQAPDYPPTATGFVRAGVELGYPNVDLNAPFKEGFDILRYPMRRGIRQAPYKAFLEPVRLRNSLTVMKFAQVNKILFKDGNIAYGVEYDRHGRTYVVQARREVIVSAGTVGSPKLLMLSGVGPKTHLSQLNIPVISDLPVGDNLQDHLCVNLAPFFVRRGLGNYLDRDMTIGQFIKWFTLGRGRLTSTGCEATGLISSSFAKARNEGDWPDIQIFSYGFTNFRDGAEHVSRIFNFKFDELEAYTRNDIGRDSLYLEISGTRPFSRGYIRLGGSSPYDKPIIDPNYLGDPGETDIKVLLEGVKRSLYLMENTTAAGVDMGARFTTARLPGCGHLEFRSDAYWICYIRRNSVTLHHPVGTASMGSVVDTQLRVIGTRNLRVVDASVQPVLVLTNTQASTLMIAEKAADMITRFWRGEGQGGKNNGFNKKPILGLFGGLGIGGHGKDHKFWWANKKRDVILDSNASPQEYDFTSPSGQKLYELNDAVASSDDLFPTSGVPMRTHVPNSNDNADLMKQKLRQSFEDLKMVSELTRDNYNDHFRNTGTFTSRSIPTTRAPIGTTTTYSTTTKSYQGNQRQTFKIHENKWKTQKNVQDQEDEYYDDGDDGYVSGDQGNLDENEIRPHRELRTTSPQTVPKPPSAPKPPASIKLPPHSQQNYYSSETSTKNPKGTLSGGGGTRDYSKAHDYAASNARNSLDDIEQYYDGN